MDYKERMIIDESALDIEALEQPQLMREFARKLAQIELEKNQAEAQLDSVKAELDFEIRSKPEDFNLDKISKITEGVISNTVIRNDRYQDALQKFNAAKKEYKYAVNAVKACEQRKDMIEVLVKLHGQQYFAGPSVPENIVDKRKAREEKSKSSNQTVAKTIRRRRK